MKTKPPIITSVFNRFLRAYLDRNLSEMAELFTPTATLWGTGIDEHRIGIKEIKKQFERDWCQTESSVLTLTSPIIIPSSPHDFWGAGVFTAIIRIDNKTHTFKNLRLSIYIENQDNVWKISHMHASFPDYRQKRGRSFADAINVF